MPAAESPIPFIRRRCGRKVSAVADPVRSEYGVHLIQVTERQPGQLSLEDARPQILIALRDQLWRSTADRLRMTAKIVRSKSDR